MIAVIADDLTGAAELAGIGHRFGLKTVLTRDDDIVDDVELWIACTDSRSLPEAKARLRTRQIAERIISAQPEWIFQKTDSVLRGHVMMELLMLMEMTGKKTAVLSPANPSLGRTIQNGAYFVNNIPVHEAGFATDPEFPVTSNNVVSMLGATMAGLQQNGITIAEAETDEDTEAWASRLQANTLPAGGSDFFKALLQRQYSRQPQPSQAWNKPLLLISGTRYPQRRAAWKNWKAGLYELSLNGDDNKELPDVADKIIIAFEQGVSDRSAMELRQYLASKVAALIRTIPQPELVIEGGATAAAILDELKENILWPIEELAQGVVRLRGAHACFTLKPGSYEWPEQVKERLL